MAVGWGLLYLGSLESHFSLRLIYPHPTETELGGLRYSKAGERGSGAQPCQDPGPWSWGQCRGER